MEQHIRSFSAPTWLIEKRLDALQKMEELSLPKLEDKMNITKWNFTAFENAFIEHETTIEQLPDEVRALIGEEQANLLVQHDQSTIYVSLTEEAKQSGVIFTDIFTALNEHSDLVKKYFMTNVAVDEHKLTALHLALLNGGLFLYVPKNVSLKTPFQAIFIHEQSHTMANHTIVVAEQGSEVHYVENYLSLTENKGVANIVAEVFAMANAKVQFSAVDTLGSGLTTYINRRGTTQAHAEIDWALGLMNNGNTISENVTNLMGEGSNATTKAVAVACGEQIGNFTTRIVHFAKYTNGHILKHGVVKDAATSIFNGIGHIHHGASKSDAQQESRVLMLSEKARGDANPILLIDENDVMAGHAASVGRVDPTQLYYLMSRGIPKTEAERLVIHGFLAPVVAEMPLEAVRKQLTAVIERKVR